LGSSSLITNLDGEIVQHVEYVPFGEVFIEERNNAWNTPYLFNAKELDEETGLYYYGARYYDARISLWLSTDPLQEKYPNVSTYAYTFQNPIKYVDPDGKDIVITGTLLDKTVSEMQAGIGKGITLSYDKNNSYLSYTRNASETLSLEAEMVMNAIDDRSILLKIRSVNGLKTHEGKDMLGGGSFLGNDVIKDSDGNVINVVANQVVNPDFLKKMDDAHGAKPGQSMMHEISEALIGIQNSKTTGISALPATWAASQDPASAYKQAHDKALPQSPMLIDEKAFYTISPLKGLPVKFSAPRLSQGEWDKYIDWKYNNPEGNIYVKFYDRPE
jgi:RHS repeat-associated protein